MRERLVQSRDTRVDFSLGSVKSVRQTRKGVLTGSQVLEPTNRIYYVSDSASCVTVQWA